MARAWEEVITTTVCPTGEGEEEEGVVEEDEEKKRSPFLFSRGTDGHTSRLVWKAHTGEVQEVTSKSGCGRRAEESVNEGTAQAEKASTGLLLFQKVAPSCIIFLTPLQEGLMTPSPSLSLFLPGSRRVQEGGRGLA